MSSIEPIRLSIKNQPIICLYYVMSSLDISNWIELYGLFSFGYGPKPTFLLRLYTRLRFFFSMAIVSTLLSSPLLCNNQHRL